MASSSTIIIRLEIRKSAISFGEVAVTIGACGGDIVATDVIRSSPETAIRDITVHVPDERREALVSHLSSLQGLKVVNVSDRTFLVHLGGKIEVTPRIAVKNREELSHVYTPGVAKVCRAIHEDESKAFSLTIKRNTVAIVSDGTAVLGLGDIGPYGAMPVMEGKAMLFKQFAGVDGFPICLATTDTEDIIRTIKNIAPGFGGINLEDISSPRCFEIEERLKEELDIPVFHDDQHGTAVVMLAGMLNALKIVGKRREDVKLVIVGIGAAGVACAKMLLAAGFRNVVCVDRHGAIRAGEAYDNPMWSWLAEHSNPHGESGGLDEAIAGADIFLGVSGPGVLKVEHLQRMARDPIVFAMANPEPEIEPELAEPYVRVMATGRSDYPNQINNVLCFPGIFRGALECRARSINEPMKLAAAEAIASSVSEEELSESYIIPSVFNEEVVQRVRTAVIQAAIDTGVARRIPRDFR
ncbi:NAD-dependent malic enzyme [Paenibacillus sp. B01]|uniref:NAD-dependent malic enzyme n=1 Tax=Paenibacillus sp. B01 TaxID=2660554 RepID=UPI00129AC93C|nr:NAD-dependent malic enzyme [Paenibacillus sp. B01]QGG58352.1 NAD-dependent malic enzyme [Paenibacillus sp. B01]